MARTTELRRSEDTVECKIKPAYLDAHDGTSHRLPEQYGMTLLIFISVYCGHCIDLLPHLQSIRTAAHPNMNLRLVTNGSREDIEEMTEYFGWDFPVFSMSDRQMEEEYDVARMPFALLLNDEGTVIDKEILQHAEDLERFVYEYICEK